MLRSQGQNRSGDYEQTNAFDISRSKNNHQIFCRQPKRSLRGNTQHNLTPSTCLASNPRSSQVQAKCPSRACVLVHSPNNILTVTVVFRADISGGSFRSNSPNTRKTLVNWTRHAIFFGTKFRQDIVSQNMAP